MRKAPISTADQSNEIRADDRTNKGGVTSSITKCPPLVKKGFDTMAREIDFDLAPTRKEAYKIASDIPVFPSMPYVNAMFFESLATIEAEFPQGSGDYHLDRALTAVLAAGYVLGVRNERARRSRR
jgi:hypothetical protein